MFLSEHLTVKEFSKEVEIDFEKSHGSYVYCNNKKSEYLDFFQFFSSNALGYGHQLWKNPEFQKELLQHAQLKISSGRVYSKLFSDFIEEWHAFASAGVFKKHFFIHGGALAVENALKVAFDKKRLIAGTPANEMVVVSFKNGFHGVSGYTASLTDLPPSKIHDLPKFPWPRLESPFWDTQDEKSTIEREEATFAKLEQLVQNNGAKKIAAVLIEPIQCSGGDIKFRPEFFRKLRKFCDANSIALIFDEIQTGFFATGPRWYFESIGVVPDILVFGKKAQVCGIAITEEFGKDGAFMEPYRLSVTWDGHILDIVRAKYLVSYLKSKPNISADIERKGKLIIEGLKSIPKILNPRGAGFIVAFDFSDQSKRDLFLKLAYENAKMLVNSAMSCSIRIRPHLETTEDEISDFINRTKSIVSKI